MTGSNGASKTIGWRTGAAVAMAVGIGVFLVVWHATSFRLEVEGASVLWVALVAFGAMWPAGERWLRTAIGMAGGMVAGVSAYYGAQVVLPLTPMGRGIGLGVGAAVTSGACLALHRHVSIGGGMIGYGLGAGVSVFAGIRPTSGIGDLFEVWMALGVAILAGVFGARVLRASAVELLRREAMHTAEPHEGRFHVPRVHMPHLHVPRVHLPHRREAEAEVEVEWDAEGEAVPSGNGGNGHRRARTGTER